MYAKENSCSRPECNEISIPPSACRADPPHSI